MTEEEAAKYDHQMEAARAMVGFNRRRRVHPLKRGWTGSSPQGQSFGHPTLHDGTPLENFDSRLLEYKMTASMKTRGRMHHKNILMAVGNGNGMAGFALVHAPSEQSRTNYFKIAVNRAAKKLIHINRYEDRTVYHDYFTQFGKTKIFVRQQPKGSGVKAHRVIIEICKLLGIKDLHAKISGSVNTNHIVKAFFLGLLRQRTHQELANEKRLLLVELRAENQNFPRLVASPENGHVRTKEEIPPNEILDFETTTFEGHVPDWLPPKKPFYNDFPSYQKHIDMTRHIVTHENQAIQMLIDYGAIKSHFTDRYPECKPFLHKVQVKKDEGDEDDEDDY